MFGFLGFARAFTLNTSFPMVSFRPLVRPGIFPGFTWAFAAIGWFPEVIKRAPREIIELPGVHLGLCGDRVVSRGY